MGTPDVGTASAGMASRASDAATAFANPAGMTRLTESQLMVGVQPLYADIQFDTRSSTFGGGDGGNAGGLVPTGSLSYINNTTDSLKFGLTAGSYLGLGIKFDDDWAVSAGFAYDSSPVRNANRPIVRSGLDLASAGAADVSKMTNPSSESNGAYLSRNRGHWFFNTRTISLK
jgi:long-subunit fatty acid transport protein